MTQEYSGIAERCFITNLCLQICWARDLGLSDEELEKMENEADKKIADFKDKQQYLRKNYNER